MNKSEQINELCAALGKAQSQFPVIGKTKEVVVKTDKGTYKFKYAPLEEMISTLRPILAANGLGFSQGISGTTLETIVFHASGQWVSYSMPMPEKASPQQYGSELTYKRRYSLKAALGVETDDDDDANAAEGHHVTEQRKRSEDAPSTTGMPSGPITPTDGAMGRVLPNRREVCQRVASSVLDCFEAGKPLDGFRAYDEITDSDERSAIWALLKPHSKIRTEITRIGNELRKANLKREEATQP